MNLQKWIDELHGVTRVTWRISKTIRHEGRLNLFKQFRYCQHAADSRVRGVRTSKSTGCPATMQITLRRSDTLQCSFCANWTVWTGSYRGKSAIEHRELLNSCTWGQPAGIRRWKGSRLNSQQGKLEYLQIFAMHLFKYVYVECVCLHLFRLNCDCDPANFCDPLNPCQKHISQAYSHWKCIDPHSYGFGAELRVAAFCSVMLVAAS